MLPLLNLASQPFHDHVGFDDVARRIASIDLGETPDDMRTNYARLLLGTPPQPVPVGDIQAVGGVEGLMVSARAAAPSPAARACLVWCHGGGYVFGSPETHWRVAAALSTRTHMPVFLPRYRLAPEHAWPAQMEDARAVVRAMQRSGTRVILGGDSAGGHLALTTALSLTRDGSPVDALVVFSPNTDRSGQSTTRVSNTPRDPMNADEDDTRLARLAFGSFDPRDPQVSPLLDDLSLLPPTHIEVGAREVLLDDARLLATRARAAGAHVSIHVEPDAFHMWQLWTPWLPQANASLDRAAAFLQRLR